MTKVELSSSGSRRELLGALAGPSAPGPRRTPRSNLFGDWLDTFHFFAAEQYSLDFALL